MPSGTYKRTQEHKDAISVGHYKSQQRQGLIPNESCTHQEQRIAKLYEAKVLLQCWTCPKQFYRERRIGDKKGTFVYDLH